MKLVIVESPTKAKTISSFLGASFHVLSSYGHVRDLPKSKLGIDTDHDFAPTYVIPSKSKPHVAELKKEAKKADEVILATDEDREGEAIAWHIAALLGINTDKARRIVFHEITKQAITNAINNSRGIDMSLVDAQQARRVLDRLVGYGLSPFLWRKIRYGLSAGRVQSVALRLVVEKEREIEKFNKEEYWTIEATFKTDDGIEFPARLRSVDNKVLTKLAIDNKKDAEELSYRSRSASWHVDNVTTKETHRSPAPPFTTSTLQQEAARRLGWSAKQTMMVAQRLYEQGRITYMRTDSVNLSSQAIDQARNTIASLFGKNYIPETPRHYSTKSKNAQEAHEAIRPTDIGKGPHHPNIKDARQNRLYELIWKRAVACQMNQARLDKTTSDIANNDSSLIFRATGQVVVFDGFMRAYTEGHDGNGNKNNGNGSDILLPPLQKEQTLSTTSVAPSQHFTEPPARYTDASLVKTLEAYGIGRPSTYAPTLSTIKERGYVEKEEKKYRPTEIGCLVNDMLVEHFPNIVDVHFTANIEKQLDEVADGTRSWTKLCKEFYTPFKKHLDKKEKEVEKNIEVSDTPCPHCKEPMLIKFGRMGKFLACPNGEKITLPMPEEAAQIKELEEKTRDEKCPKCGASMNVKRGRFGFFLACSQYPECKGTSRIWNKTGFSCPACAQDPLRKDNPGDIVLKKSRGRGKPFYACTRWPDCQFITNKKPASEQDIQDAYKEWKEKESAPKKKSAKKKSVGKKNSAYKKNT